VETKVETLGLLEHISLGTVKVNKRNEKNYSISYEEQYRYYPYWIRHIGFVYPDYKCISESGKAYVLCGHMKFKTGDSRGGLKCSTYSEKIFWINR
jgi:hypothetical protein